MKGVNNSRTLQESTSCIRTLKGRVPFIPYTDQNCKTIYFYPLRPQMVQKYNLQNLAIDLSPVYSLLYLLTSPIT